MKEFEIDVINYSDLIIVPDTTLRCNISGIKYSITGGISVERPSIDVLVESNTITIVENVDRTQIALSPGYTYLCDIEFDITLYYQSSSSQSLTVKNETIKEYNLVVSVHEDIRDSSFNFQ